MFKYSLFVSLQVQTLITSFTFNFLIYRTSQENSMMRAMLQPVVVLMG